MSDEQAKEILGRLDILIALLLESKPERETSLKEQILRLHRLGLQPAEIGRLLGKPTNQITATIPSKKNKKV